VREHPDWRPRSVFFLKEARHLLGQFSNPFAALLFRHLAP
jgi:hypothetical protein